MRVPLECEQEETTQWGSHLRVGEALGRLDSSSKHGLTSQTIYGEHLASANKQMSHDEQSGTPLTFGPRLRHEPAGCACPHPRCLPDVGSHSLSPHDIVPEGVGWIVQKHPPFT